MRTCGERGQVLILLAAWLFFGGGATSALVAYGQSTGQLLKSVKRTVSDAGRRDMIRSSIRSWDSIQELRDKTIWADREAVFKILRRQDAQPPELESLNMRLDNTLAVMDREFLDLRFRVKGQVSSEEWSRIVAGPSP